MQKRLFPSFVVPLAVIVVLALLFFYRLAFTDLILARGDTFAYFYPYWDARDAALSSGNLPLWSPDLFMGVPLLANSQLGTFYPPNGLTVALAAPDAIRVSILIHIAWAGLGAFWLARRALNVSRLAALTAAVIYAMGGYVGSHVEQINQLHGLAWMPWLFLLFTLTAARPGRWLPVMALVWSMQIFSGHTQTVFITGVGLGIYALGMVWQKQGDPTVGTQRRTQHAASLRVLAHLLILIGVAAAFAVIVALPQLIPTQELISISNRGGGLTVQQATAFSLEPAMIGRGLLPSYEGQPFGEYVAYIGVIGLGLAVLGVMGGDHRRWTWLALVVIGVIFALGRFTPVYWAVAELPGFNLFRVPARWLALTALGAAMLAALGVTSIEKRSVETRYIAPAIVIVAILAVLAFLADRSEQPITGPATPTAPTLIAWAVALAAFASLVMAGRRIERGRLIAGLLALGVIVELWTASHTLPYNDVTDPSVYNDARFTINQLRAYAEDDTPPGRFLSISNVLGDPGDRAALEARWDRMNLGEQAQFHAFNAVKLQEVAASNLPLTWGIPTIDGFDGGVLPTMHYTAFTSLMLPEGALRTVDGRLREILALPDCRGACLPDDRWLDLTNTRYLLVDKVYDEVVDGVFFDTTFDTPIDAGSSATFANVNDFTGNSLHLLYDCAEDACRTPDVLFVMVNGDPVDLDPVGETITTDRVGLTLTRFETERFDIPDHIIVVAEDAVTVAALSLVDTRTGDFVQLTPPGWERVFSGDVKIYENLDVLPRAFMVYDASVLPDTWDGTEAALEVMRDPSFDVRHSVTINDDHHTPLDIAPDAEGTATITSYDATRMVIDVETNSPGYLVVTDAFYPGWTARTDDDSNSIALDILRGDVMLRAIPVMGSNQIVLEYESPVPMTLVYMFGFGLLMIVILWYTVLYARQEQQAREHRDTMSVDQPDTT